ncbi:hypothetical protein JRC04_05140 [Mycolicibacterium sp. S2-37]|nr:hypothetical protein [Mycolicibacterium sp. S2-37]MBO0676842.1 hypothetical protein [Mycolicibacterium sp. S2-37]
MAGLDVATGDLVQHLLGDFLRTKASQATGVNVEINLGVSRRAVRLNA